MLQWFARVLPWHGPISQRWPYQLVAQFLQPQCAASLALSASYDTCTRECEPALFQLCQLAFAQWVAVMERVRARRQDDVKNADNETW